MKIESILAAKGRETSTIAPETKVAEAVREMREKGFGALVVSRDGARIEGIVSERGVMHAIADAGPSTLDKTVGEIMTAEVFTCEPKDPINSVMAMMTDRRIRHIPVVEDGRLCGLVSIGDVVKYRLDEIQSEAQSLREYISGTR